MINISKIYHWNEIKHKVKNKNYIIYVELIKDVVYSHNEIVESYIFGSFARELLAQSINPEYRHPKYGRHFRKESDIDVFVLCEEKYTDEFKGEGWCCEELMILLENEPPEIDGHEISWDTAGKWMVTNIPFKIQIKP